MWERSRNEKDRRWNSQVTSVSFDALGGTEALSIVGIAHAGMAIAFTGWTKELQKTFFTSFIIINDKFQTQKLLYASNPYRSLRLAKIVVIKGY